MGKLPEDDPPPEEKYHCLEMASKEKLLRKVQVALDSSVGRSLELDIEIAKMEKMTPPGQLDFVEEGGGCEGPGPADSPRLRSP